MEKKTLIQKIFEHADKNPDKICVADKDKALSYVDFKNKMTNVANYLIEVGIKKQEVVGLRAYQNVDFVVCLFAIQSIGAIVCPIEKTASVIRTKEILSQISSNKLIDGEKLDIEGVEVLSINYAIKYESDNNLENRYNADDISDIIYTTGTTGKSKGILVSHRTNVAIAENVIDSVEMSVDEVELITSPTSHSLALRRIYGAMYIGSTVVLTDKFLLYENFWGLIEKYKVTAITFVPAILTMIMKTYKDKISEYDNQFNYIQLGSAPLHEEIKNKLISLLPTTRLYNTYGATESGCTIILEFSKYGNKKGCIGRTTVNTSLFFTDRFRENIVEANDEMSAGYMCFSGEMNMSGYVNDFKMTEKVLSNGIIYTNDIGYIGNDGLVYLLGRDGEVINRGGYKINPLEIEEVALQIEGVRDAACVPKEDVDLGQIPKLFVVLENNCDLNKLQIKNYCRNYLEDYKIPADIEYIDSIPRTFNGKIKRKALIEM